MAPVAADHIAVLLLLLLLPLPSKVAPALLLPDAVDQQPIGVFTLSPLQQLSVQSARTGRSAGVAFGRLSADAARQSQRQSHSAPAEASLALLQFPVTGSHSPHRRRSWQLLLGSLSPFRPEFSIKSSSQQTQQLCIYFQGHWLSLTWSCCMSFDSPLSPLQNIFWVRIDQIKRSPAKWPTSRASQQLAEMSWLRNSWADCSGAKRLWMGVCKSHPLQRVSMTGNRENIQFDGASFFVLSGSTLEKKRKLLDLAEDLDASNRPLDDDDPSTFATAALLWPKFKWMEQCFKPFRLAFWHEHDTLQLTLLYELISNLIVNYPLPPPTDEARATLSFHCCTQPVRFCSFGSPRVHPPMNIVAIINCDMSNKHSFVLYKQTK